MSVPSRICELMTGVFVSVAESVVPSEPVTVAVLARFVEAIELVIAVMV